MKNLILLALVTLSFGAFAESQDICNLHIYKAQEFKLDNGQTIKAKTLNHDQIPLEITAFPKDLVILNDADGDVLGYIHAYDPDRGIFEEMRSRKDITERRLSVKISKRYIMDSVYLNIVSDNMTLDIPLVSNQKLSLNIPLGKDVYLNCEN